MRQLVLKVNISVDGGGLKKVPLKLFWPVQGTKRL